MRITTALLAITVVLMTTTGIRAEEVNWRHDYATALKESKETNRPIFIDCYTQQCFWCVKLDAGTFKNHGIAGFLNRHFIPLKLDGHRNTKIAKELWVRKYPTIIIAAPDGTVVNHAEGYMEPITLHIQLQRALTDQTE